MLLLLLLLRAAVALTAMACSRVCMVTKPHPLLACVRRSWNRLTCSTYIQQTSQTQATRHQSTQVTGIRNAAEKSLARRTAVDEPSESPTAGRQLPCGATPQVTAAMPTRPAGVTCLQAGPTSPYLLNSSCSCSSVALVGAHAKNSCLLSSGPAPAWMYWWLRAYRTCATGTRHDSSKAVVNTSTSTQDTHGPQCGLVAAAAVRLHASTRTCCHVCFGQVLPMQEQLLTGCGHCRCEWPRVTAACCCHAGLLFSCMCRAHSPP